MTVRTVNAIKSYSPEALGTLSSKLDRCLYDLDNTIVARMYREAVQSQKADAYSTTKKSWVEISNLVSDHIKRNGDGGLIVLSYTANRIWGAIPELERNYGCAYIPAPPLSLNTENTAFCGLDGLRLQLRSDMCAVKYLGYSSLLSFMRERRNKAMLKEAKTLIVGVEKADIHDLYKNNMERGKKVYAALSEFISEHMPSSLLYACADMNLKYLRKQYKDYSDGEIKVIQSTKNRDLPRDRMIEKAANLSIPVKFANLGGDINYKVYELRHDVSHEPFELTGH